MYPLRVLPRSSQVPWRRYLWLLCLLLVQVCPRWALADETPLRVMTYNLHGAYVTAQTALAVLRPHRPDLLLLQEVRNVDYLAGLGRALGLSYWHFAPYTRERGGVAILSRWPLGPAQTLPWPQSRQGKLALAAQVAFSARTVWATSVHMDNPLVGKTPPTFWQKLGLFWREFFTTTPRMQEAQALRDWLQQLGAAETIIGGDFNSVPFARADRYLRQYFRDALAIDLAQYFRGTYWGPPHGPFLPRVDYVYYSPHWQVVEAQVIQHKASDHFPVLAVLIAAPALKPL
ncbi:MAG: hypothetical protein FJZ47_23530 [Candidatus Tectomicrobia bacterium]|uniref:Endonuclease/exonuclease/phosphatase domain-containing protein n=1 Tax=Tectimicrobiota bacterium TaxID=2528274 RepID=A0A937W4I2_UNCTE|nr:hypothetical protein [Candidatus Tectomicrobia bacterium]